LASNQAQDSTTTQAVELDQVFDQFENSDACTVHRDNDNSERKRCTEGMRRSIYQLLRYLHLGAILSAAAAYDLAYTFLAYLKKQYCTSLIPSPYVGESLQKKYCIDRFHRRNHTRPECKTTLSCSHPVNQPFFENENTQVCEQLFSHLKKLKSMLRSISWPYSNIFYCLVFHLRNCRPTKIFPDNLHLAEKSNIPIPTGKLIEWTQIMVRRKFFLSQSYVFI
jgi:hypothetical protein